MTPTATRSPHRRLPALDGLRGLAILLVLGYHIGGGASFTFAPLHWFGEALKQGWIGVLLFFVLSGFLITGILWDSRAEPHWLRNFYARRALRILPLYWFALLLTLVGAAFTHTFQTAFARIWSPLLFLQDFPGLPAAYLSHNYSPLPTIHLWSLAVEEQFYLLWPFLLLLTKSRRSALTLCTTIFALSSIITIAQSFFPALNDHLPLAIPHAAEIAAGAWLAIAFRTPLWPRLAAPARILAPLALALFILAAIFPTRLAAISALSITLCFAALLVLTLQPGLIARALSAPILRWLGKLSYGIYVYHVLLWPLFKLTAAAIARSTHGLRYEITLIIVRLTLTLLAAWLSFRFLEQPFLRLKRRYPTAGPADRTRPQPTSPASIQPST